MPGELGPCHVRFPTGIPLMESIRPQLASNHSRITLLCHGCRCQSLEKVPHIWHEAEAAKTALQMLQHQHQQLDTAAAVTLFHRLVRLCCTHAGLGCRALLTGCCRGRKKKYFSFGGFHIRIPCFYGSSLEVGGKGKLNNLQADNPPERRFRNSHRS